MLELGLAAPQACFACDAGFATLESILEVALGSASGFSLPPRPRL